MTTRYKVATRWSKWSKWEIDTKSGIKRRLRVKKDARGHVVEQYLEVVIPC